MGLDGQLDLCLGAAQALGEDASNEPPSGRELPLRIGAAHGAQSGVFLGVERRREDAARASVPHAVEPPDIDVVDECGSGSWVADDVGPRPGRE